MLLRCIAIASILLAAPAFAQVPDPDDEPTHEIAPAPPPPPMPPPPLSETPPPPPDQAPPPDLAPRQNAAPLRGPFLPPPLPTTPEIDRLEKSGRSLKAGGGVMIALGAALEISGQVMVLHSQFATTQKCTVKANVESCSTDYNLTELVTGVVAGLAAGGLLYGGLAVLSAGGGRVRRAQSMRLRLRTTLGQNSIAAQAALSF